MTPVLAHAGHWIGTIMFAAPALLVAAGIVVLMLRERLR